MRGAYLLLELRAEGGAGLLNLLLAGEEDEHVPVLLLHVDAHHEAHHRVHQAAAVAGLDPRPRVEDVHGVHAPRDGKDGAVPEVGGELGRL